MNEIPKNNDIPQSQIPKKIVSQEFREFDNQPKQQAEYNEKQLAKNFQ